MSELVPRVSVFTESGFYLRNPRSGVEAIDFAMLKASGFKSLALNYGDHAPSEWAEITTRASIAGLTVLPWARCLTDQAVSDLCTKARKMPARAVIVNSESEFLDRSVSSAHIGSETAGLDACLSTLPWVGDPPPDFVPLEDLEIHLQLFPQEEFNDSTRPRACRAHAYDSGAKRVSFMYGVHAPATATQFPPRQAPYWVYTLDDCQTTWGLWMPTPIPSLTVPYTGPLYGPSQGARHTKRKTGTAKALKIALHNAGFASFPNPDRAYNAALERAMRLLQRRFNITPWTGSYGKASYEVICRLASATPGETYALTPAAEALIREDV